MGRMCKTMRLFFDTETSGLPKFVKGVRFPNPALYDKHYSSARLLELAWLGYNGKHEFCRKQYIIKPNNVKISKASIKIHGLTMEKCLSEGIDINEVFDEFEKDLSFVDWIIGHNVDFDYNIILAEAYRNKRYSLITKLTDTNRFCSWIYATNFFNLPKNNLGYLYHHLIGKEHKNSHRAMGDTEAVKDIFFELERRNTGHCSFFD